MDTEITTSRSSTNDRITAECIDYVINVGITVSNNEYRIVSEMVITDVSRRPASRQPTSSGGGSVMLRLSPKVEGEVQVLVRRRARAKEGGSNCRQGGRSKVKFLIEFELPLELAMTGSACRGRARTCAQHHSFGEGGGEVAERQHVVDQLGHRAGAQLHPYGSHWR